MTDEEHKAFIDSLLSAVNENRLLESFLLRPGEWLTYPNAYLRKAMERFDLLKSRQL